MERKLDYPIKYAVLEVKENGEYLDNKEDAIKGFIVSKCYVVKSILNYLDNGNINIIHEVVFPFKDITYFKLNAPYGGLGYRNIPLYDVSGEPYPINRTDILFNSFEEAKKVANFKNEEVLVQMTTKYYDDRETLDPMLRKYRDDMAACSEFESAILRETEDMVVNDIELTSKEDKKQILNLYRR